jgi:putative endonuclease
MTQARIRTGKLGEDLAVRHLAGAGWRIVARNWRGTGGEIDLIALEAECLVLVEVRTRHGLAFGGAAESLDVRKQRRMARLAQEYVLSTRWTGAWRVDAITLALDADDQVQDLVHYRDALLWQG